MEGPALLASAGSEPGKENSCQMRPLVLFMFLCTRVASFPAPRRPFWLEKFDGSQQRQGANPVAER